MAYTYRSRRSARKLARSSQRNFIITLIIVIVLIYSTITWVLPFFIGSIGMIKNSLTPVPKQAAADQQTALAPPTLNIPYEATNSANIDIAGYATPHSKVKLYLDDNPKQTTDVDSDGNFTFSNISLSLGTNNIYGTTVDDNNKESLPSKTIKLVYKYDKPSLTVSEPEGNKTVQGGDKKVRVAGKTDPGVKILVNGTQVIVDQDGNFSTDQTINEGTNTVSVKAIDIAANTSEIERTVTYNP